MAAVRDVTVLLLLRLLMAMIIVGPVLIFMALGLFILGALDFEVDGLWWTTVEHIPQVLFLNWQSLS